MNKIDSTVSLGLNFDVDYFCVIQQNVHIGNNITLGNHCTICEGAIIEDNVSIAHNVVIGIDTKIEQGVNVSSGCLIDQNIFIGQYAQLSLGEKVLEDILPFAQFKGGKIVGVNLRAIVDNAKNLKIDDVEYMQAEAWRVIEYISTHPLSYAHKVKEELKKAQNVPDGKLLQIICEFALSQRNGRNLAKAAPL